jgi:hypothetical protein
MLFRNKAFHIHVFPDVSEARELYFPISKMREAVPFANQEPRGRASAYERAGAWG